MTAGSGSPAGAVTFDAILDRLRQLDRPAGRVADEAGTVDPWSAAPTTSAAVRNRRFAVFGHTAKLPRPIDWSQDPHQSRSWRYQLHTLTWLRPAVERHALGRDTDALAAVCDVGRDWCERHVAASAAEDSDPSEFAWYDMAVGLRAPYLAYALRAGLHEERIDDQEARLLLTAVERHGAELADSGNYATANNHGLFQDEGLHLLASQLPALPLAREWKALAAARMLRTLRETVSFDEGAHLEHSTAYQFAIVNLLARLTAVVEDRAELDRLLDRLRRTAAWQVTPAGRLVQLGDTDDEPAPPWARDTAAHVHGLNALFEAGQAYVRDGDSYLALTAAHHGPAHKQSDDTGFVLVERGRTILGDAGRWGYYEREPDRIFARSNRAHNVLVAEGRDLDWRRARPYGSGLLAAGEGEGWYALLASNRLLAERGIAHRRLLLYRPATALIAIDDVRSDESHEYARHFHLGRHLEAELDGGRVRIAGPGVEMTLADLSAEPSISLVRGRSGDDLLGWTFPSDRQRAPVWTATLRTEAADATLAAALSIDGRPLPVGAIALDDSHATVELGAHRLEVEFAGPRARVSLRSA